MKKQPTYYLTLASGKDRWEKTSRGYEYAQQGELWNLVICDTVISAFIVLKEEVDDWCFENTRGYRLTEYVPKRNAYGIIKGDEWRIQFKNLEDMTFFKMRWM